MATKAIVGEKVGMTQVWDDQNRAIPVTVVRVSPARVVQVKTVAAGESVGYGRTWWARTPRHIATVAIGIDWKPGPKAA